MQAAATFAALGLSLLALGSGFARADCDHGTPHPDAPPQTAQFGFLIGDFDIALRAWQGEGWSPPRAEGARWNGRYGLNGMAIYDEWFDPGPDRPDGVWGVNVRSFDPAEGLWKIMWLSLPTRQVQDMRATVRDGTLTMWQVYPERPDWQAQFEIIDADHWARISFRRDGPGAPWLPEFRLEATRIPCDAAR